MMKIKTSLLIIISVLFSGMAQAKEKCDFWVDNETAYDEITNLFNGERYSGGKVSGNLCSKSFHIQDVKNIGLAANEMGNNYYVYPLKQGKIKNTVIIKGYSQGGSLLVEIPYKKGIIDGLFKIFFEDSKQEYMIFPIKNGVMEGIKKMYYENGNINAEVPVKNGKNEGVAKEYDENGKLIREILYKNNKEEKRTGYKYYESGELEAILLFESSKPENILKKYYKNGNLQSETHFKNNKRESIEKHYYENGMLMNETPYENGKREGVEKIYDKYGKLFGTVTYINGEIKSGKCANGIPWTSAELANWENSAGVLCD